MKLFVGGISQDTTEEDLANYFQSFGPVGPCVIVYDKITHASKGYAFITCENSRTAQRILQLKEHVIQDRVVEVTEALGRQGLANEEAAAKGPRRLFVGGLSFKCTRDDLLAYFSTFGEVHNAYIIFDPKTGASKNFGYVEFADKEDAVTALSHPVHFVNNKPVTVEIHKNGSSTSAATTSVKKPKKQVGDKKQSKIANYHMNDTKHSEHHWDRNADLDHQDATFTFMDGGEFFFDEQTPLVNSSPYESKRPIVPQSIFDNKSNFNASIIRHNFEGGPDATSWPAPIRARRPYKTFYKNLKRTHVQKRLASRSFNEENYVYRKERVSSAIDRLAHFQIAYLRS